MKIARHWLAAMALACAKAPVAFAQEAAPDAAPQDSEAAPPADAVAPSAAGGEATEASQAPPPEALAAHAADYEQDGKWFTAEELPTFQVENGVVDWYTFSGYRRYHSECHVCHGPDGQGSSYAPAIANSAVNMDYYDFVDVVVNGKVNGNSVMPSFGDNLNVMCYLDDVYVYLKAVGAEAIPRGRPPERADKPEAYAEAENACMG